MLKNILNNFSKKIVTDYLMFFIAFFIVLSGPKLPKVFKDLFNNKIFKVIFLILIVYKSKSNTKLSIMLTLFYLVIINRLNSDDNIEKFNNRFPIFKEKFTEKKKYKFKDSDNLIQKYCVNRLDDTDIKKVHYPFCCVYSKNRLDDKDSIYNPKKITENVKLNETNWLKNNKDETLKKKYIASQNIYDIVKKCFPKEF